MPKENLSDIMGERAIAYRQQDESKAREEVLEAIKTLNQALEECRLKGEKVDEGVLNDAQAKSKACEAAMRKADFTANYIGLDRQVRDALESGRKASTNSEKELAEEEYKTLNERLKGLYDQYEAKKGGE